MAQSRSPAVDEYIAAQPEAAQSQLSLVREILHKALPEAEEVIAYRIPAYKLHGAMVLYFAGWKQHYSLYPVSEPLAAGFGEELAPYRHSKGTLRFPLSEPVPRRLIEKIAQFRAKEAADRTEAKRAGQKQSRQKRIGQKRIGQNRSGPK